VLWSRHLRGERKALQQLITYNTEDVVHLKAIMEMAYDRLAADRGDHVWAGSKRGHPLAEYRFRIDHVRLRRVTAVMP
jgi:hypothetical protein